MQFTVEGNEICEMYGRIKVGKTDGNAGWNFEAVMK